MSEIAQYWQGPTTQRMMGDLKDEIAIADSCGRNVVFLWYIEKVVPKINDQARKESITNVSLLGSTNKYPHIATTPLCYL